MESRAPWVLQCLPCSHVSHICLVSLDDPIVSEQPPLHVIGAWGAHCSGLWLRKTYLSLLLHTTVFQVLPGLSFLGC
jgi:hypothetical protein